MGKDKETEDATIVEEQLKEESDLIEVGDFKDERTADILTVKNEEEKKRISAEVKEKFKGIQMFTVSLPYNRIFVIRPQDIADIKEATQKVEAFVEEKIVEVGGRETIEKMDEEKRISTLQAIDAEAADMSNEICLTRCVLYPYDFAEKLKTGVGIPAGSIPLLLEKIYEVSGWQDVEVEEI